jgi:hypothetical protein
MAYRYILSRSFPRDLFDLSQVSITGLFIALNPSTADDVDDDATVRRWNGYARSWGWHGYHVVNLYAWRATDPKDLWKAADPVGNPENDLTIGTYILKVNGPVVCCWGNNARVERVEHVLNLLLDRGVTPYALRLTRSRQPEHVLRLPKALQPRPISELLREVA